jgi:hypothetical protein
MSNGREIWLRIEIDWKLFAGYCLFDSAKNEQVDDIVGEEEEVMKYLDYKRIKSDEWWIDWKYLPTGERESADDVPEFHNMNAAAISLADDTALKNMVKNSVAVIENQFLAKIL